MDTPRSQQWPRHLSDKSQVYTKKSPSWPSHNYKQSFEHERNVKSAGRYSTSIPFHHDPPSSSTRSTPGSNIKRMFTYFPWRNMSWLVGVIFFIGSICWLTNGILLVLPFVAPSTVSVSQTYWTGTTAVLGGVIYVVGGYASLLEVLNLNRGGQIIVTDEDALDQPTVSEHEYRGKEAPRKYTSFADLMSERATFSDLEKPCKEVQRKHSFFADSEFDQASVDLEKRGKKSQRRYLSFSESMSDTATIVEQDEPGRELQQSFPSITKPVSGHVATSDLEKRREETQRGHRAFTGRDYKNEYPPHRPSFPSRSSLSSLQSRPTAKTTTTIMSVPALYGAPNFLMWPTTLSDFFRDLYSVSAFIQFIACCIFMIAVINGFHGVIDITNLTLFHISNLFPATLGGVLFINATMLQMVSTQPNWFTPRPLEAQWYIGYVSVPFFTPFYQASSKRLNSNLNLALELLLLSQNPKAHQIFTAHG